MKTLIIKTTVPGVIEGIEEDMKDLKLAFIENPSLGNITTVENITVVTILKDPTDNE